MGACPHGLYFYLLLVWSSSGWNFLRWRFQVGICVQYKLGGVSSFLCEFSVEIGCMIMLIFSFVIFRAVFIYVSII